MRKFSSQSRADVVIPRPRRRRHPKAAGRMGSVAFCPNGTDPRHSLRSLGMTGKGVNVVIGKPHKRRHPKAEQTSSSQGSAGVVIPKPRRRRHPKAAGRMGSVAFCPNGTDPQHSLRSLGMTGKGVNVVIAKPRRCRHPKAAGRMGSVAAVGIPRSYLDR